MKDQQRHNQRLLMLIIGALALWGTLLALGALLFGVDETGAVAFAPNVWRGLIVLACVAAFLGVWLLLLRTRRE